MDSGDSLNLDAKWNWLLTAVQRKYLSEGEARDLRREAEAKQLEPSRLAVENGLLTSVQSDIVRALAQPADVAPGYEIVDVLGHGGLGVVFKARQLNLDRIVALKTVLVSRLDQPGILARFEQEARTIGGLRHPNIVSVIDFGNHNGRLFLTMELIDGVTISSYVAREGRLREGAVWSIARQMAAGLAHAAERNVVHRDIKPDNVLLTDPPAGYPLPQGVPMARLRISGWPLCR
jgi:serine/threonine protein kinase